MKRRLGDGGSSSQRGKMVRRDPDRTQEFERPWEVKAGMIMEVLLRNFMCHETFVFKPNQRLNFLCGENGSGKSAVLTAIVFVLGGTARMSNRGNSNKGFIRTGQNSATVDIKLANVGESQYRPDLYGDVIIVSRTVTHSTSTYKLKNSQGRVVVEKKTKEELNRILAAFNIQVENPITVLNQDTSKNFLAKSDPEKLYQFFHKSTQLKNCEDDYNAANNDKIAAELLLVEKKEALSNLKKEKEKWQKKWEFFESLEGRREEITKIKQELAWAVVRDGELETEELRKVSLKETKKVELADKALQKSATHEKEWREKKKRIEQEIQQLAEELGPEEERVEGLKQEYKKRQDEARKANRAVAEVASRRDRLDKDVKALVNEINKYRSGQFSDYEQRHKERLEEIDQLTEEIGALNAQLTTNDNHNDHLEANRRECQTDVENAVRKLKHEKQKLAGHQNEIQTLEQGSRDKLMTFATWMPHVVTEISKCPKFKKQPLGPLGSFINIKEGVSEDNARLVENEVAGLLNAFCVDNSHDQKVLFDIFSRRKLPNKPTILTTPFSSQKHDIANGRVNSEDYVALIDCITVDNPTVYNCLVDQCGLEKILVIPKSSDAQRLLKNKETVPRNLRYALVESKYQYYPAPDYRSYHIEIRSRGILKASLEEYIKGLKVQVEEQAAKVKEEEKFVKTERDRELSLVSKINEGKKLISVIRDKIREKNSRITTVRNQDEAEEPPDIAALEDDLEKYQEKLTAAEAELEAAKGKHSGVLESEAAAKTAKEAAEQDLTRKNEEVDPLNQELTECEEGIRKSKRDNDHFEKKKNEYQEKSRRADKEVKEKEDVVQKAVERAKGWAEERIDSTKTLASLKRDIERKEDSLKQQERTQEPREEVREKSLQYRRAYHDANQSLTQIARNISLLDAAIKRRKEGYKVILRSTSRNVNNNFTTQLTARKYVGQLKFEHSKRTLTIYVDPASSSSASGMELNRDLKSLSGGEKSYSLVSFILSLWNVMTPPFRILDEFDVFMDAVNRRIALQNIINFAQEDRQNQFIFLTPLNTSNIEVGDDLKIIKLSKLHND